MNRHVQPTPMSEGINCREATGTCSHTKNNRRLLWGGIFALRETTTYPWIPKKVGRLMGRSLQAFLLAALLALAGCGGSQPVPDWTYAGYNKLEDFKAASLAGRQAVADLHFQRALEEIKKSGDLRLLAMLYLNRYAVQTALLEPFDDEDFRRLQALQPVPENAAFHAFLKGDFRREDRRLLPPQYASSFDDLLADKRGLLARDVRDIPDPLSRLVMTGRLVLSGYENEELLGEAVATASRQGWKRALLVYLDRQQRYYEAQQENAKAAQIRERIRLIQ